MPQKSNGEVLGKWALFPFTFDLRFLGKSLGGAREPRRMEFPYVFTKVNGGKANGHLDIFFHFAIILLN